MHNAVGREYIMVLLSVAKHDSACKYVALATIMYALRLGAQIYHVFAAEAKP
jgi:hypothetical protein